MGNKSDFLFSEFDAVSAKQWKQKIQFDLRGADYNDTLVWQSLEGIKVKPFYHKEDLQDGADFEVPMAHHWKVAQNIYVTNAKAANQRALNALKRGAESLIFTIADTKTDWKSLLAEIDLDTVPLHFDFQFLDNPAISALLDEVGEKNPEIYLNQDIIGHLASTGNWFKNLEDDHQKLEQIEAFSSHKKGVTTLGVDMSSYQNAGANMVQQLAYGLAHANEYLNHFKGGTCAIAFKVAVGGNYFFEIAKLRALRWLWKTLAEEYGIEKDCHILCVPSKRSKTLYDYNVNMLRTTAECMSAVLGGADSVCNLPYDALYHKDNEFGRRIARNQLLILKQESYFDSMAHASNGAYYIEALMEELAAKAMELFKQIEKGGGFLSQLKTGTIQKKIHESAQKEQQLFDQGKLILVGTNKYQNDNDRMQDDLELYPFIKTDARKTLIPPIIERRLAETLEKNRLKKEG